MRYFIQFSYRGTNYHGSQSQPNGITVQAEMERAIYTILREPIALTFAGRTDAGVHAEQMYAHFDTDYTPDFILNTLAARLNNLLPADIAIHGIQTVPNHLHARFSAVRRRYEYRIVMHKDPFTQDLRTRVAKGLDFDAMNEAAQCLLGTQDFASFCRVHTDVKTTLCTVHRAFWTTDLQRDEAVFTIEADRFLRNMVRAVVGTLFDVGRHKISIEDFQKIIAGKNRCLAGNSACPDGLYLVQIDYPDGIL